jgi:hypothetical protein
MQSARFGLRKFKSSRKQRLNGRERCRQNGIGPAQRPRFDGDRPEAEVNCQALAAVDRNDVQ